MGGDLGRRPERGEDVGGDHDDRAEDEQAELGPALGAWVLAADPAAAIASDSWPPGQSVVVGPCPQASGARPAGSVRRRRRCGGRSPRRPRRPGPTSSGGSTRSATSASPTASCPGSTSAPACSTSPRTDQPVLERVKFLAIFSERLDEFFQVRVAGLEDQVAAGLRTRSTDGLRPSEQLRRHPEPGEGARRPPGLASSSTTSCRRWPRRASGCRTGPRSTTTTAATWSTSSTARSSRC